ncbi:hypothetical protein ACFL5Z_10165 [Planctomycetota bacterium]
MSDQDKPDPNDIRSEYAALSSFHNSVVSYRFTLLGFFVAAVGIILSGMFHSIRHSFFSP